MTPTGQSPDSTNFIFQELITSVGILISMLEERIDPTNASFKEMGHLARLIARELKLPEFEVECAALAGHLYGLDIALRLEVSSEKPLEVIQVFDENPRHPGGIGPSLRQLGAKALGIKDGAPAPIGILIIQTIQNYLELRSDGIVSKGDLEYVKETLYKKNMDPNVIDALLRSVNFYNNEFNVTLHQLNSKP